VKRDGKIRKQVSPEWLVEYGRLCLDQGKLEEVDEVLEKLDGVRAKRAGAPLLRAAKLRREGKLREAEDQARRLILDFLLPRLGEAYWEIAEIASARQDALSAAYFGLESFRHGAPLPRHVVLARLETWCQQAGVEPAPMRAFFQAIELRGPFGARGRPTKLESEQADKLCERLLKLYPDFWAGDLVLHTRGSHFFYQEEDWERSLEFYQAALERYPRGETRCRCSYQIARAYQKLERLTEAEVQVQRALEDCSGDLAQSARGLLGKIRRERGRVQRSEDSPEVGEGEVSSRK
jgi:tetratricopeptide (TPR) repeat protein